MIQEANIGIGIYGNEGMRAVQVIIFQIFWLINIYNKSILNYILINNLNRLQTMLSDNSKYCGNWYYFMEDWITLGFQNVFCIFFIKIWYLLFLSSTFHFIVSIVDKVYLMIGTLHFLTVYSHFGVKKL